MKKIENYYTKMHKAIKYLKINNYINKKPPSYNNQDLTNHYMKKFSNTSTTTPQHNHYTNIKVVLNLKEGKDSIMKLTNNRSNGYDKIQAELIKLLHIKTIEKFTHFINSTINNDLPYKLGLGILIPIQKPNKKFKKYYSQQ